MAAAVLSLPDEVPVTDPTLAVARSILIHGPIARTVIADQLGLSLPTLTRIVKPLIQSGFASESSERQDRMGRPTKPLTVRPRQRAFLGIKLTGDEAFAAATDLAANEIASSKTPLNDHRPETVVEVVTELHRALQSEVGQDFHALGISLGGSANNGRRVDRAPFLDWRNVNLAELVEASCGLPTILENDVTALTAAEHWFGVGRGETDFAVVTIGAGVGLGMVTRDRVVRSRDAGLGLAGHIPLDPLGPVCMNGHRGCSSAMLAIPSMCTQAAMGTGRHVSFPDLIEGALTGDQLSWSIVSAAATSLGKLLALVANLAMVDTIIVSGEGLAILDIAELDMWTALRQHRDPEASKLDVRIDRSGFDRWARGAAAVAIQASLPSLVAAIESGTATR